MSTVEDTAYLIAHVRAEESLRPPEERLFEDLLALSFPPPSASVREGIDSRWFRVMTAST